VISQTPSSGTLFRGKTVQLVVSDGPEMVKVPTVRANGIDEATQKMESAGFQVRTENAQIYLGLGYVESTDPPAGTMAPKGSVITLFLV
jgi:serine/threonine-protein kinase